MVDNVYCEKGSVWWGTGNKFVYIPYRMIVVGRAIAIEGIVERIRFIEHGCFHHCRHARISHFKTWSKKFHIWMVNNKNRNV